VTKSVVKRPVYHGSNEKFDRFVRRPSKRFVLFTEFDVESPAFFFAPTPEEAAAYGRHVAVWQIDVRRPFVNTETERHLGVDPLDDKRFRELRSVLRPLIKRDQYGQYIDLGVQRHYLKDNSWPYHALGRGGLNWDVLDCAACVRRLVELGYDGTTVAEPRNDSGYSWAIFDAAQAVKLSDVEPSEPPEAAYEDDYEGEEVGLGASARFYHITQAASRSSIDVHGLRVSTGWSSGSGVFVTTNPEGWLFMFEDDGVYATTTVDIWEVDVGGFALEPDENETATAGEDFIVPHAVSRSRIQLTTTLRRRPGAYEWRER
jgi:hypothetical protein